MSVVEDKILWKKEVAQRAMAEGLLIDFNIMKKDITLTSEEVLELARSQPSGILTFQIFERWLLEKSTQTESHLLEQTSTLTTPLPTTIPKGNLKVVFSYQELPRKRDVQDFVKNFSSRFSLLQNILRGRQELLGVLSLNKLLFRAGQMTTKEQLSFIAMVKEKQITKNNRLLLKLEDPTGNVTAVLSPDNPLFEEAREIHEDEVLGFTGFFNQNLFFIKNLFWPDVPSHRETKRSPVEEYALFVSDLHIGSKQFLAEDFKKFIQWTRGEIGTEEHKALIPKIKYLFVIGDLVDGIGVYPGQEEELEIKDIKVQYEICAQYLKQIPQHIHIILCPGNHDHVRLAEPQPIISKEFAPTLHGLPNVTMVSNPAYVNIGATELFPGFDILMYHGFSFDYYISNIDSIRTHGGYDRSDLVMKHLLKRRHVAPCYGSTQIIPDEKDNLVITRVPDFFITGHVHKSAVAQYRGITMVCGSCFQGITSFQIKVGHHPEPGRVPLVNLQTRDVKILRF